MSTLADRWVRIMCDYCADPVWASCGGNADLADLPVTRDLRERLERWAEWHDRENPTDGPWPDQGQFSAAGLQLAREVKAQLADWTVIYFDDAAAAATRGTERPRQAFEYEIKL